MQRSTKDHAHDAPQWVDVIGDVSIEPVPPDVKISRSSYRFLIMGPTGAGKSSFIEALASQSQNLGISKDQLAGCTQSVTAYRLVNVTRGLNLPIYLVDTPGFSDSKISEIEIVEMVQRWHERHDLPYVHKILFLTPITNTRLAGSRRRTIEMLKVFLEGSKNMAGIIFVTTMWDSLTTKQSWERARSNSNEMEDVTFKKFLYNRAGITEFWNTKKSALQIIGFPYFATTPRFDTEIWKASPHLYEDLHGRIEGTIQQKRAIESELADPDVQMNPELKCILEENYRENEELLTKFLGQLSRMGEPSSGFERSSADLGSVSTSKELPTLDSRHEEVVRTMVPEPEISNHLEHPIEIDSDRHHSLPVIDDKSPLPTHTDLGVPAPQASKRGLEGFIRPLFNGEKWRGAKLFKRGP